MTLFLHSLRLGYATNSSSTHSIIILNDTAPPVQDDTKGQRFGWDFFTAASKDAKLQWLGQCIADQFRNVDADLACTQAERLLAKVGVPDVTLDVEGYVDHDSRLDLPIEQYGDNRLLADVAAFLSDPRVVICGGNDNTTEVHPLVQHGTPFMALDPWEEVGTGGGPTVRYDQRDGYWSMFTGGVFPNVARFRIAVDPGPPIVRSEVPELVDLSIGNVCSVGCAYCYRGSVPNGAWADAHAVVAIIDQLADIGTHEVALGGGDPMEHPRIDTILGHHRDNKMRLHVTTRRVDLLTAARLKHITALGLSVDTAADAERVISAVQALESDLASWESTPINLQVVVGMVSDAEIVRILDIAERERVSVTLLGHKTTGRGSAVAPLDVSPEILRNRSRVGVDTVLAKTWAAWLEANAWAGSFALTEGAFSCFIDAQTKRLYRSSYDRSQGTPLGRTSGDWWFCDGKHIVAAYQGMQVQECATR